MNYPYLESIHYYVSLMCTEDGRRGLLLKKDFAFGRGGGGGFNVVGWVTGEQ